MTSLLYVCEIYLNKMISDMYNEFNNHRKCALGTYIFIIVFLRVTDVFEQCNCTFCLILNSLKLINQFKIRLLRKGVGCGGGGGWGQIGVEFLPVYSVEIKTATELR